jgi:hypothetical protein
MEDFMTVRRIALVLFCAALALAISPILRSHLGGASGAPDDGVTKVERTGVHATPEGAGPGNVLPAPSALPVSRFPIGYLEFEDDPEALAK